MFEIGFRPRRGLTLSEGYEEQGLVEEEKYPHTHQDKSLYNNSSDGLNDTLSMLTHNKYNFVPICTTGKVLITALMCYSNQPMAMSIKIYFVI